MLDSFNLYRVKMAKGEGNTHTHTQLANSPMLAVWLFYTLPKTKLVIYKLPRKCVQMDLILDFAFKFLVLYIIS